MTDTPATGYMGRLRSVTPSGRHCRRPSGTSKYKLGLTRCTHALMVPVPAAGSNGRSQHALPFLTLPEASSLPFMSASVAGRRGSVVLPPDFRIGDAAVDHRHGCALMAQDGHDHLDPRSVLGQLGAPIVAQSVCADGPGSLGIDESCGRADLFEGVIKKRGGGQQPALADKNVLFQFPCGGVVTGRRVRGLGVVDRLLQRGGRVGVQRNQSPGVAFAGGDPHIPVSRQKLPMALTSCLRVAACKGSPVF
jgi:hypothetical protein